MEPRVLVIDDSPTIGSTVAWLLAGHGCVVESARDGLTALSMIQRFQPDLLLLDIRLPNIDGIELCGMIRGDRRFDNMPIVMLSALGSSDYQDRARQAGANDFLVKPIEDVALLQMVDYYLSQHSSRWAN
ncbi:MAG: response regulator [Chloroflexi bacterium]|nr:response regulator [Chloroflexota bacterium]